MTHAAPALAWVIPFVLLLGSIAILPLVRPHWWEKNYTLVSLGLGLVVVLYYLAGRHDAHSLLHTGAEYLSFIALIGALYVVAGGIHINVKGEATPLANCVFLAVGAVLANFLGTTGASMVLIRPWIRMNKYRVTSYHIVFFIFIVSNIGGGLTPIGDPPLFLGYLKGVPFFWVLEKVWHIWGITLGIVLFIFWVLDTRNFRRAPAEVRKKETGHEESWTFSGAHNVLLLLVVIGSVFINDPPFLREAIMAAAAALSYKTTPDRVHKLNEFSFGPIREVAVLFLGIFATMIPALQWLEHHASEIGIQGASAAYWTSGVLSSVLDNAPTYLNFLSVCMGLFSPEGLPDRERVARCLAEHPEFIRAISVSTVFFGAMTYIGNGPNFLVRSIALHQKVRMPSFFGYVARYSAPVLLPVFGLIWVLFFRAR